MEKKDICLSSLIRQFARRYGSDLPCLSLRYAVAALSAGLLPSKQFNSYVHKNKDLAVRELNAKFQSPENFLDSDVFAVFLVCILKNYGTGTSTLESKDFGGFLRAFYYCVKNSNGNVSADSMLIDFGPLLFDWLESRTLSDPHQWSQTHKLRRKIFRDASSFQQRLKYFPTEQIQWQSCAGWALRFTISILVHKLCSRIAEVAINEQSPEFQREKFRADVQHSIDMELGDEAFQNVMRTSESWQEPIPTRYILLLVF